MKKDVLVIAAAAYLIFTTGGAVSCEAAEMGSVGVQVGAQLLTGNNKTLTGLPAGEVVLLGFAQQEDSESSGAEHYGFGSSGGQVEAGEVEEVEVVPEEVEELPAPEQMPSRVKPSPKQEPTEELEPEREPEQTPKQGTTPYKQPEAEVPEDLNEHYAEV